jgi:hypothetical protein
VGIGGSLTALRKHHEVLCIWQCKLMFNPGSMLAANTKWASEELIASDLRCHCFMCISILTPPLPRAAPIHSQPMDHAWLSAPLPSTSRLGAKGYNEEEEELSYTTHLGGDICTGWGSSNHGREQTLQLSALVPPEGKAGLDWLRALCHSRGNMSFGVLLPTRENTETAGGKQSRHLESFSILFANTPDEARLRQACATTAKNLSGRSHWTDEDGKQSV